MNRIPKYDVIIVGAGLAGCAAALSLKQLDASLSVLILERKPAAVDDVSLEPVLRIGETVPAQIEQLLRQLNLLDIFKQKGYKRSFGTSAAWGSDHLDQNEFIYSTAGYGYVVDRADFDELMQQQVLAAGIAIRYETSLYKSSYQNKNWTLQTLKADSLKHRMFNASFVIDASGRKAAFASQLGAKKIQEDQLVSLYTYFTNIDTNSKSGALIESVAYGWWYSNFFNDGSCILALMTDAHLVKQNKLKGAENFYKLLDQSKHTRGRLPESLPQEHIELIAAHTQYLDNSSGEAWLAIGDAASCYDPLSSLGMYKSFQTAIYGSYASFDWLNGNPRGITKYDHLIKNALNGYRKKKQEYYNLEQRFTQQPFWKHRKLIA